MKGRAAAFGVRLAGAGCRFPSEKEIFGNNIMPQTFTELLREERDRY
jgi:hypothetical protein